MISRVLPPSEWHRLDVTGFPPIQPCANPPDTEVIVVEDEGRIVASMYVMRFTHLEGAWVDPRFKGNAGVVSRLLKRAKESACRFPESWAVAFTDRDDVSGLVSRLGGVKIPVESFVMPMERKV